MLFRVPTLAQSGNRSYTGEVCVFLHSFLFLSMNSTVKVIQPSGILDGTQADKFRREVSQSVEEGSEIILIDFQEVTFMDSSGLGALVLSLKTARSSGANIYVCAINDQIQMLFELTSMDRVFEIFATRQEFEEKIL